MEAHLSSRRGTASTSGGPTTSQAAAKGDTSHSRPAACDVALEVSWGRTGSPAWYPVLGVRLCAKHRGTKIPGRGPCPQGTLGLVAENTLTLSIPSQHTHPRPSHHLQPPHSRSPGFPDRLEATFLHQVCPELNVLSLGPGGHCLGPASVSHSVFTSPCIIPLALVPSFPCPPAATSAQTSCPPLLQG